jgi:hypothetical protein
MPLSIINLPSPHAGVNRCNSRVGPTLLTLSHCDGGDVWARVYFTTKQCMAIAVNRSRTGKIQVYTADAKDIHTHRFREISAP